MRSVEDPRALRCQYHRLYYSVADSTKYDPKFNCAILGNVREAKIQTLHNKIHGECESVLIQINIQKVKAHKNQMCTKVCASIVE